VHHRIVKGLTARVLLVSGVITLILGAAFALLLFAIDQQREAGRQALRSQEAITAGTELQRSVISLENGLRGYVASGRDRSLEPWNTALREYPEQAERLASLVSSEPSQQDFVRQIQSQIDDYVNLWGRPLLDLTRDQPESASAVLLTGTGRTRIEDIRQSFVRLFEQEQAVARTREERAEERSRLAIGAGIGGLILVFVLAAGIALFLRRYVVRPVKAVADASAGLADGDMSVRVPPMGGDEIGDLGRAFNEKADKLERSRKEVADRTQELEHSNDELNRFASVVSHDLQAPLATVNMYAQLLERRHGDTLGKDKKIIDGICAATGQARQLIRDLLDYSRAGRAELRTEPVDANALVSQVLDVLAAPIQDKDATVDVADLPVLQADPGNLRQVFQNLIGNALKFCDGPPHVEVTAHQRSNCWEFAVSDDGIGMDPADARAIFEPFHRLHGDTHYSGTGIGLAICERIVERHGGRIWAESEPGSGSTFRFTLPADGDSLPKAAPRDEAAVA